jgi:hypothetical protein
MHNNLYSCTCGLGILGASRHQCPHPLRLDLGRPFGLSSCNARWCTSLQYQSNRCFPFESNSVNVITTVQNSDQITDQVINRSNHQHNSIFVQKTVPKMQPCQCYSRCQDTTEQKLASSLFQGSRSEYSIILYSQQPHSVARNLLVVVVLANPFSKLL